MTGTDLAVLAGVHPAAASGQNQSAVIGGYSYARTIPTTILEAEQTLREFDNARIWGPKSSVTRFERLARRRKYATTPGWDWVDDILHRFPALGSLKAHEQYRRPAPIPGVRAPKSGLNPCPARAEQQTAEHAPGLSPVTVAEASKAPVSAELTDQSPHLNISRPEANEHTCRHHFNRTLPNVGNTCFFNSVLQVVASIPSFVAEIEKEPLPPNHADSSYCLAFLKLFIPAIAAPSSEPSQELDMSSVRDGGWRMSRADWLDFVLRLTTKYDTRYHIGAFADPGDLLDYFLSIVPGAGRMCAIDFKWTTIFPCACRAERTRERTVCEREITISVDSEATLIHHILRAFSPEHVYDYRCDQCHDQASAERPAARHRFLLSLPRFLRVTIVAPLTSAALPIDYHRHGPLRDYEALDLSLLTPQPQSRHAHYNLRAAIMYSERHHWAYLHGHTPIFVSDDTSRVATPADVQMVALCARILIYERTFPPCNGPTASGPGGPVTAIAATAAAPAPTPTAPVSTPRKPARSELASTKQAVTCQAEPDPMIQEVGKCVVPAAHTAGETGTSQSTSNADVGTLWESQNRKQSTRHRRGNSGADDRQPEQGLPAAELGYKTQQVLRSVRGGQRQRPPHSPSQVAKTGLPVQQRVLGDFFGALLPQAGVTLTTQAAGSQELAKELTAQIAPQSARALRLPPEVSPSAPTTAHPTRPASAPPVNATPPVVTAHSHPPQALVEPVDMSRLIILRPTALGSTPWKPGTMDLYPLPRGTKPPSSSNWQQTLPLWKVRVEGLKPQQAMFQVADNLFPSAFYIAADDWTRQDGKEWGIGKRYGAFRSAAEFITNFLEVSQNRCFYEIIRKDRPCKAYLDLEADAGAMTEQDGQSMCEEVIREWKRRISSRWPMVVQQCAQSLGHMILKGSRMTGDGLKISYHVIFPWLIFPCNTTMLHDEVGSMSEMPQFQYNTASGQRKSFIDPGVYTSNRQFRLLLCNKLSDRSRTALHLSSPPTIAMFVRSCITHIGGTAGVVPQETIPRVVASKSSSARKARITEGDGVARPAPPASSPLCNFLYQMLRRQGQPNGTLTLVSESASEIKFRWQVPSDILRPCMTAQIWRPSQAGHKSNGAWVSVDRHGGVSLICLHPQCLQRGYCNKRLLGQTPLSLLSLHSPAGEARGQSSDDARIDPVTPEPNLQRDNRMDAPRPANRSEESRNPEGSPAGPHVSSHSHTTPRQLQSEGADELLVAANSSAPVVSECSRSCRKATREQSLAQVAAENQHAKNESFQAWMVETGQWGGRVVGAPETTSPSPDVRPGPTAASAATLQDWVGSSEAFPFSVHPPDPLLHSVQSILLQDNARHAREHVQTRLSERPTSAHLVPPRNDVSAGRGGVHRWSVGPAHAWLQAPIASRPSTGCDLLDRAALSIRGEAGENLNCPYRMDTWSSPFTVGYLNVGRRHLVGSLPEVVELVLRHRPDILFLGDLVTSRNHIGRLKKRLESDLQDEWFVTTNISALHGRPVGVGAIVHCSLANHMTDCVVQYPDASGLVGDKQVWAEAVDGRIQCIKITRPGSPFTWQFVGVYQHVARSANRTARALIRHTLHDLVEKARKDGHRVAILGDFNAAPPGGRWGYSKWSATAKEDQTMTD